MLTKDLLRFRVHDGVVTPQLLKATPAISELAENLLHFWRAGIGQTLGALEDAALPILHQTRSLLVAKGLQKLILDSCTFREAASCAALREQALAASAAALTIADADPDRHRERIANALGLSGEALSEALYGDLPDAAVLVGVGTLDIAELIARYNLAQCQGLLLTAKALTVTIRDGDTGIRRKLLKALRFQRLLGEVRPSAGGLSLVISGPGAVLDQASRYGLNLALFLPALACLRNWEATAEVVPGKERIVRQLKLGPDLGLVGDSHFLGYVPEEVQTLAAELAKKRPEWEQVEPGLLSTATGELIVPDLELRHGGRTVAVELFHRWHAFALERRLEQLAAGELPTLVLGVDRAAAKRVPGLADHPLFVARGFLFNDIPTVRALGALLSRG